MKVLALSCAAWACLCAPALARDPGDATINDPFESWNRKVFQFNDAIDKAAFEPLARGYRTVTPRPVRKGVTNILRNLRAPIILANDLLQGEPARAGKTTTRFVLNTTVGVVGVFDVATQMGLERHDEDLGQTLGKWGMSPGPYLILPLMGPSSVRDLAGRFGDAAFDPINYATFDEADEFRLARGVATVVSAREGALEAVDNLRQTAIDPYVTTRSAYGLLRASAIENGRSNVQDLPDFEDIPTEPASGASSPEASEPNATVLGEPGPGDTGPTEKGEEPR
jgi:phospholipid-binding lipoprotein MlaA